MQLEYDGQGFLLRITEDGNIRRLVRDRTDQLARPLVEMDATTNAVRWFVWANGKLLAQVESNGAIRVAHSDELGKILALTDVNGALTDEYAYQPYGRLIAHSGVSDLSFSFMGDYGVWDAGNGLHLTRHRAYDANLMRFMQADPIGIQGGYNLYTYAEGAPSVFTDPSGLRMASGPVVFVPTPTGLSMQDLGPVRSSWEPSGINIGSAENFWDGVGGLFEQARQGGAAAMATENPFVGLGITLGVYPQSAVGMNQFISEMQSFNNSHAVQQQMQLQYGRQIAQASQTTPTAAQIAVNPRTGTVMPADAGPAFYPAGTVFVPSRAQPRKP